VAGGASAGSSRTFRLDPNILPVRFSAPFGGAAQAVILLDRERAVVRGTTRAGVPITLDLPVANFDGVAVRMVQQGDAGAIRVFVELRHRDPGLTLPLIVADEPEEVAADWQAWGRTLNLPLLVVGQDGSVMQPVQRIGSLTVAAAKPRRRHSFFAGRRPRFLTRRKVGHISTVEVLFGREIIART
jgi:Family of unknown function (DUF6101)